MMGTTGLIKDKEEFVGRTSRFFEALFGQNPSSAYGDIEVRVFTGPSRQHFCPTPKDAAQVAYELCSSEIDTYFGVNPRMDIGEKYREHKAPEKYLDHCIESAKKLLDLTEEERLDPLFISRSIQKEKGSYSLNVLKFEEYMSRKHRLKYLEDENTFFMYTGKCYEPCRESFLNSLCQTQLGTFRGLFKSSTLREFLHFCMGGKPCNEPQGVLVSDEQDLVQRTKLPSSVRRGV